MSLNVNTNIIENPQLEILREDFFNQRSILINDIKAVRQSGKLLCGIIKKNCYAEKFEL